VGAVPSKDSQIILRRLTTNLRPLVLEWADLGCSYQTSHGTKTVLAVGAGWGRERERRASGRWERRVPPRAAARGRQCARPTDAPPTPHPVRPQRVYGSAEPGQMLALMGPSGAGKVRRAGPRASALLPRRLRLARLPGPPHLLLCPLL
jgi:hypothetical protein